MALQAQCLQGLGPSLYTPPPGPARGRGGDRGGGAFPAGGAWGQRLRWTPGRCGGESAAAGGPWGSLLAQVGRKPGFESGSISCQVVCPALQPLPSIQLIPEHPRPRTLPAAPPPPPGLPAVGPRQVQLSTLRARNAARQKARGRGVRQVALRHHPRLGGDDVIGLRRSPRSGEGGGERGEGEGGAPGGPGTAEGGFLSANLELSVSRPKATGPAGALGSGPWRAGSLRPPEPLHLRSLVPGGGVTRSSSGAELGLLMS